MLVYGLLSSDNRGRDLALFACIWRRRTVSVLKCIALVVGQIRQCYFYLGILFSIAFPGFLPRAVHGWFCEAVHFKFVWAALPAMP